MTKEQRLLRQFGALSPQRGCSIISAGSCTNKLRKAKEAYQMFEAGPMELVAVLQRIEKRAVEPKGQLTPFMIDPQEFGVTLIDPHDRDFIPAIQAAMTSRHPQARICLAIFPQGAKGDKLRLLLGALFKAVGHPALTREQPTDELMLQILLIMEQKTDFLIVDNAEYLNQACLHFLRRDRGMVPAILVGRHRRFFQTLARYPTLNRRALVVDSPVLGG